MQCKHNPTVTLFICKGIILAYYMLTISKFRGLLGLSCNQVTFFLIKSKHCVQINVTKIEAEYFICLCIKYSTGPWQRSHHRGYLFLIFMYLDILMMSLANIKCPWVCIFFLSYVCNMVFLSKMEIKPQRIILTSNLWNLQRCWTDIRYLKDYIKCI